MNEQIHGSLDISRNATVGGRALIRGSVAISGNITVDGWMDAPNIKTPCKGLYADLDSLLRAYPHPHNGWWALVGDGIPAEIYQAVEHQWVDTGNMGGETVVDLAYYDDRIADTHSRIDEINAQVDDLAEAVDHIPHPIEVVDTDQGDLVLADSGGAPLLTVTSDGHIRSAAFDSTEIDVDLPIEVVDTAEAELVLADERGTALLAITSAGHIRTGAFDSAAIIADPSLRPDKLWGKKWYVLGDSFSEGDFSDATEPRFPDGLYQGRLMVYPYYIGQRTGIEVHNLARCGMTLAAGANSVMDVYQSIPADADYVTIYIGINDSHQGKTVGGTDAIDIHTFAGAYNTLLAWLVSQRPYTHVGVIVSPSSQEANWSQYSDATRAAARRYGIPVLDICGGEDVPYFLRQTERQGVSAGVRALRDSQYAVSESNRHPNARAHELQSHVIEQFLRRI